MRSPTHSTSPLIKCIAPVSPYPSHSSSKSLGGRTPHRSRPMRLICVYLRSSVDKYCISNAPCRMRSPTHSASPLLKCMATVSESFFEQVPWWTNATTLAAYATNLRLSAFICGQTLHIACFMQDAIANSFNIASSQVHGTRIRTRSATSPLRSTPLRQITLSL